MSGAHEVSIRVGTLRGYLIISNSNLDNHNCLILCLYKRASNNPQYVLLHNLQFFQEYLTLSTYNLVITRFILYYHTISLLVST